MEERLKRRLVGAVVLVSLAVIFLPMLLEEQQGGETRIDSSNIPTQPRVDQEYQSRVLPLPDDEPLIPPLTAEDKSPAPVPDETTTNSGTSNSGAPAQTRVGLSAWVVQVASLSSRENAQALVAELRKRGHGAFLEQVYVNGKELYRVRVGPEVDRERARAEAQKIFEEVELKGQVVRYP